MIDTETFVYLENRWQDIFMHLKNKGFDVYPPATHKGDCISTYIVVQKSTSSRSLSFSTNEDLYDILIYVPKNKYSEIESTLGAVKNAMKDLYPMVKPYGQETQAYYDSEVKGHMVSVMYVNYKKLD